MLEGARMIPDNRCKYIIFMDNCLIYSGRGYKIVSLSLGEGTLQKIIEIHLLPAQSKLV